VQPLRKWAYRALRCPICRSDLRTIGRALSCSKRHSYDLASAGYVNLLAGPKAAAGDTRAQLQRRRAFLASGAFDFIADAIVARSQARRLPSLVLDAGSGTGYHLARIAHAFGCSGLGLDSSRDAVRMAAQSHAALGFAVVDLWREWPVRSATVDLLINIFAPRNFDEMARALQPHGQVALAFPGPHHLAELREAFGLIGLEPGKADHYRRRLQAFTRDIAHDRIVRTVPLDHCQALDLILMGPNARHFSAAHIAPWSETRPVTFDVELLTARRRT
jgi:23S rRNA (guanine745-N1)-methyltransferase